MVVHSFRFLGPHEWEGEDLAGLAVYHLRAEEEDWVLDVFTAAETNGDPWLWGEHYDTVDEALSAVPALPEACQALLQAERGYSPLPSPGVSFRGPN